MPETRLDQMTVVAALMCILFSTGPDRITILGEEYIDALSFGALRGTNPANPADRHDAVMLEAWRIREATGRSKARAKHRRRTHGQHANRSPG